MENKDPGTFQDVKVFAGDKFLPPADVTYRNLTWDAVFKTEGGNEEEESKKGEETIEEETTDGKNEKRLSLSGVVKKNTHIGIIPIWGPHFRVSFEIMIKSFTSDMWTNIFSFKGDTTSYGKKPKDRAPTVNIESKEKSIVFFYPVNGDWHYSGKYKVELNKWYKITIEQIKKKNGKVRKVALVIKKKIM